MVIVEKPVTAIEDVRAALNVVADGLLGRTTVSAGTWDAAVATLAASHSHLGGHTRELLYRFFQASDPTQDPRGLKQALFALAAALDPPPVAVLIYPAVMPHRRPRRRSLPIEGQLALF